MLDDGALRPSPSPHAKPAQLKRSNASPSPTVHPEPVHTALTDHKVASQRRVTLLGATGSIGTSTLDLIAHHPDRFAVAALTGHRNAGLLIEQARRFRPELVAVTDAETAQAIREGLAGQPETEVADGPDALLRAAELDSDIVVAGIVGAAGLPATLAAIRRGASIAFANKECLVCAGELMLSEVAKHGSKLLPVDSEHNAIFQVMEEANRDQIAKLILTASGGPFRDWTREAMREVTPEQAVAHPTWSMGAKISVDSATMTNKGLELIEAYYLFGMPAERIDIVVHPQSVVHSMVAYTDGSVLAQLGTPDMRTPIAYCLSYPQRMDTPCAPLDFATMGALTFEPADEATFPALKTARQCLETGGTAPTVMNAANEVAVAAFLNRRIGFLDIEAVVAEVMTGHVVRPVRTLEDVFAADAEARRLSEAALAEAVQ